MNKLARRLLYWAPRALSIAFILFISLFALDAFGHGQGFWRTLGALFMHLIPSFVLLAMLILAWRWEWIGGLVSTGLGVLFLWWNFTCRHNVPSAVLMIAGPLFLMAALFFCNWFLRDHLRSR
jgi:hypothetical protein